MSTLRIQFAWAGPAGQGEILLELPEAATVQLAIDTACLSVPEVSATAANAVAAGVWGKVRALDYVLRDGDRVELYRALQADPKDARRTNAQMAQRKSKKM